MPSDGHPSKHVEMEPSRPNDRKLRGSRDVKKGEGNAEKGRKRSKRGRSRAHNTAHVEDRVSQPTETYGAEPGGFHDDESQELRSLSSGQAGSSKMVRNRDADLDVDASFSSRPESSHGRNSSKYSVDSGDRVATVENDSSEELPNGDFSDNGELLPAYYQPPSHQISSGGSDYSLDEAESSDLPISQSMHGPALIGDSLGQPSSPRKRKSTLDHRDMDFRPLKKAKGAFNRAFLDILNEDIEHAAAQYVPLGRETTDERIGLPASQIGMVVWTVMEKERFFEALGRLGQDDTEGIARRIRTKGEMEVRQYLRLLQDALAHRRQQNELDPLELADFPAAVELSHECCEALEEAADSLALRQEHSEQTSEQHKHGSDWLVTQEKCREATQDETVDGVLMPTSVLNVPSWLQISERLFMNGTAEERNWQSVDGDHPSIRRATLEDFYSLVLTLTRRLVAASIYVAGSRTRAERGYNADTQNNVYRKDVRAAALSLGLKTEKQPVLAGSARRLGLHVYENPPRPTEEEDGMGIMSYDAVEHALGINGQQDVNRIRHKIQRIALSSKEEFVSPHAPAYSDNETGSVDSEGGDSTYEVEGEDSEGDNIKAEADEIMLYSAVDQPQTKRDREALFRRIKAEREQESYADAMDAQATYQEERRMWEVLARLPSQPLVDPGLPPGGRRLKVSVDAAYSVGKNWRAHTKGASEWESRYQPR